MYDHLELSEDHGRDRRLIGKLNYLTITWPKFTYQNRVVSHPWWVIRMFCSQYYLKSSPRRGLLYSNYSHNRIDGFSHADSADCSIDRRLTIRYYVFFCKKSYMMEESEGCCSHMSWYGHKVLWLRWDLCSRLWWGYIVLINLLFTLHQPLCFMKRRNILK